MAITFQQAVQFMNGPIGSQLPWFKQVFGKTDNGYSAVQNFNSLNGAQKAMYLQKAEKAMQDAIPLAVERLKNDVAGYVIYQNLPGGGGTAKSAAKDLKANIDKYVSFLQDNGQSVDEITSVMNQGSLTGVKSLEEQVKRQNEVSVIDRVTDVALNVGLGSLTAGLSTGAQLALNAAIAYDQGAKPEDIIRGVVGSLVANQFRPLTEGQTTGVNVIDDFNKKIQQIGNPELQSAIFNGLRQGVYATATEQNIAKNIAAGSIAGAIATNIQNKYNDPALANASGEYIQAKIAGKSDLEAAAAAFAGYATEEEKANAKKVVDEEVSALPPDQVQALGYKPQDEITASTFPEEKPLQVDVYGGAGTEVDELPTQVSVAQRDPENLDGLSLIRRVRTGTEIDRGGELAPQETVAQRDPEEETLPLQRLITESVQETQQKEPETQRQENNTVLLGLLGGTGTRDFARMARTQREPNERQAASMQALSQALSVGDAGDALFGSGLGRRKNVWNVESLRLKDELGG